MTVRSVPTREQAAKIGRRLALELEQNTEGGDQRQHDLIVDAAIAAAEHWRTAQLAAMELRELITQGQGPGAAFAEAMTELRLDNTPRQVLEAEAEAVFAWDDGGEAERWLPAELLEQIERDQEAEDR